MCIRDREKAVRIMRLRLADKKPLVIEDVYFSMQYAYLLSIDLEHDSLYKMCIRDSNGGRGCIRHSIPGRSWEQTLRQWKKRMA